MSMPTQSSPSRRWAPWVLCGLALVAGVAGAAPTPPIGPVWAVRNDQPDKRNTAFDLVVDAAGNSYAVYRSGDFGSAGFEVSKYNTAGQRSWSSGYGNTGSIDSGISAVADADGDLIVVGSLGDDKSGEQDIVIAKFATGNGNLLWDVVYSGPDNSLDQSHGVAVDAAGDVYVVGDTTGADDSSDALLLKLDSEDGSTIWEARFSGEDNTEQTGNAVVVDGSGNVYIAGTTADAEGSGDILAVKFNAANGAELWTATYDGPDGAGDLGQAIGLSGTGVVVAGSSNGANGVDYATVKFNATDGAQVWASRFDGPPAGEDSYDQFNALTIDANGNPVVTGVSTATGSTVADYATVKYDGNTGTQSWVARYDGPGAEEEFDFIVDSPSAVRTDAAGNVYVTGEVVVSSFRYDIGTVKYNAAGQQQWVHLYNNRNLNDQGAGVELDGAGNVYVTGTSTLRESDKDSNDTAVVVLKYLPSGRGVAGPRIPKPTFTFSESAKDKLVCFREEGETFCDEATTSSFKITSTATMQDVDLTAFDEDTTFSLSVGGLELERALGDDPRYTQGKTKATFVDTIIDDEKRTRKTLTTTVSWPRGKLKVTVASTPYFESGILAGNYLDGETGRITDSTSASVSLGDFTQDFDVAVTGKATSRVTRDEEFTLSTVTLTGKGTGI